ncbi:uncharacterized protein B0I36DRAFT_321148 [Microdochium trichocladiopsis]|uniref:Uncharacterized protein n=1 Tax=Microdochium trichocladiopsis TaxID=1682393 RepID=A0A9P8YBS6_9PEZI|nr:uncharacterized protein B0I36DRAFT_321148 [Microdochium trichocladiopsis]KAH7033292.1 hypothetical protein B0I36DRAFT_321148 [Microdochium trichocladiopsis]
MIKSIEAIFRDYIPILNAGMHKIKWLIEESTGFQIWILFQMFFATRVEGCQSVTRSTTVKLLALVGPHQRCASPFSRSIPSLLWRSSRVVVDSFLVQPARVPCISPLGLLTVPLRGTEAQLFAKEAGESLEDQTAKDNKAQDAQPERRDGRLLYDLCTLLDVVLRLAAASLLVLDELGISPALLECLRHCMYIGSIRVGSEDERCCDMVAEAPYCIVIDCRWCYMAGDGVRLPSSRFLF